MRLSFPQALVVSILHFIIGVPAATPLKVVQTLRTPNGFSSPPRGWNSFGLQANGAVNPSFSFDQNHIIQQANALAAVTPTTLLVSNDYYISLDSGWSVGDHGDDFGRIIFDNTIFDIPSLASTLHSQDLKLGVYVLPGAFCNDANKIIFGTNIPINATLSGNNNGFARCDFDFTKNGVQEWHNSVVNLFASWYIFSFSVKYMILTISLGAWTL
jgi:alpha-galactosidase